MDAYNFMVQQRTFAVHGYALNPSTSASSSQPVVGSTDIAHENGYSGIDTMRPSKSVRREQKRKRGEKGDAGVVDGEGAYMGPWAAYESERVAEVIEVDPEAEEEWQVEKKRRDEAKEAAQEKMKEAKVEKSIFHGQSSFALNTTGANGTGKDLTDYAGRTYMHIPTDLDVKLNPSDGAPPPNAYVPERCVHTWVRHLYFTCALADL
jgi:pre-mRNA-processing factor 17